MNKKGLIGAAILLVILAALATGYLLLRNSPEEQTEETGVTINSKEASDAVTLSFTKGDVSLAFEKDANGIWHLSDDKGLPVVASAVSSMANAVSTLEADREIVAPEAAEYGFEEPSLTVDVKYSDGVKASLVFGATNDFNGLVYCKDRANGKIYLVSASVLSPYDTKREAVIETDEMPLIEASDVTSLTVKDSDGNEATVTDEAALTDGATIFLALGFNATGCRSATGDDRAALGIDTDSAYAEIAYKTTSTVTDADGNTSTVEGTETFRIYFGDETEYEGETFRYYTIQGSSVIYLADEASYYTLTRYATYENIDNTDNGGE